MIGAYKKQNQKRGDNVEPTKRNAGRGGDACRDVKHMKAVLKSARGLFATLSKQLEAEMDRLQFGGDGEMDAEAAKRLEIVQTTIVKAQKALQTVLDIEVKLMGGHGPKLPDPPAINLDDARAEIERRLARLAA